MFLRDVMKVLLPALSLVLPATGCFVRTGTDGSGTDAPLTGTLSIAWTLEGSVAPALCDAHNAYDIAIDVYDDLGDRVLTQKAPCDAFVDTIELDAGPYSLDITLVDEHDKSVSTTLTIDTSVLSDTEVDIDVDFPHSAFL